MFLLLNFKILSTYKANMQDFDKQISYKIMSYNYNFPKCLGFGSGYEKICGSTDPDQRGKYQQKTANIIF